MKIPRSLTGLDFFVVVEERALKYYIPLILSWSIEDFCKRLHVAKMQHITTSVLKKSYALFSAD